MGAGEMDIFGLLYEPIKLEASQEKPIKIGTLFSGIGCPEMSMKKITNNYEVVFRSEIDKYPNMTYKEIHGDILNLGDVELIQEIPYVDILHLSPPCQDLSKAGKQKGLGKGTRSGLMYEVIRILKNTKEKPKVVTMEQVPDLIQETFKHHWARFHRMMEDLGYKVYANVLNAKNYGVAQNRDRLYMVAVLGDYSYEFPQWVTLDKRLKDYLEDKVDEKYYLSASFIEAMYKPSGNFNRAERFEQSTHKNPEESVAFTITSRAGERPTDNFIAETICMNSKVNGKQPSLQDRIYDIDGVSTTVTTSFMPSIAIPEATKQGYALAHDGDGVYLNRPHQKRGVVQDQMIQTVKTSGDDIRVVTSDLRIRKLTPLEVWRLMGISDQDYYKAQSVCSNSQLYKQAGNGIVIDVFEAILRRMIE